MPTNPAIQPVQSFRHSLSEEIFSTPEKAEKSYRSVLAAKSKSDKKSALTASRKEDSHYARLNARTFEEIVPLMQEVCKKHGIKLTFTLFDLKSLTMVGTSHSAPIGKTTTWGTWGRSEAVLGWEGYVEGSIEGGQSRLEDEPMSFSDLFGGGGSFSIAAFHGGSGCPGENFSMSVKIFLDDYPHLKTLYVRAVLCQKEGAAYQTLCHKEKELAIAKTAKTKEAIDLRAKMAVLDTERAELVRKQADLSRQYDKTRENIYNMETAAVKEAFPKFVSAFSEEERASFKAFSFKAFGM